MKRALIRMFGCVLSAIGLGVVYDNAMPVFTDDAPGVAFAASDASTGTGTGSGSGCIYANGCNPSIASGIVDSGLSGFCTLSGEVVGYRVMLQPWYVAWPNYAGDGASGVKGAMGSWPAYNKHVAWPETVAPVYSGISLSFLMTGDSFHGLSVDSNSHVSDMCSGGFTCALSPGTVHACMMAGRSAGAAAACLGTSEDGDIGPVYMRTYDAFAAFNPTNSSGVVCGPATFTSGTVSCPSSYACCYIQASGSGFWVSGYNPLDGVYYNKFVSPLYEPIVVYYFSGCSNGYYAYDTITGTDANYALSAFSDYSDIFSADNPTPCPSDVDDMDGAQDENNNEYKYGWNTCDSCATVSGVGFTTSDPLSYSSSAIGNLTTFSETALASDSGTGITTCNRRVKATDTDDFGTFSIDGTCSYEE